MSKLSDRENCRRSASIVGSIIGKQETPGVAVAGRGRPKAYRELKKRISLSVLPSLYEDIQKIAYVQRRSISDLVGKTLELYRDDHQQELKEYMEIESGKKDDLCNR